MKRIFLLLISFLCILSLSCEAEDKAAVNRQLGYFENTRTVLLLPTLYRSGSEAAAYVDKEMETIFRYPYYRKLDSTGYEGKFYDPSMLPSLAEETGADIVVMPVITRWSQHAIRRSLFFDGDDIIETHAVFDIYSYKQGDPSTLDSKSTYWQREEEGNVRNRYIFDDMMKKIYKTFPYRRVPTDVAKNLSGGVDETPVVSMGH